MLILTILYISRVLAVDDEYKLSTSDIANGLVDALDVSGSENPRMKELREKLKVINGYVVDREKIAELLINITTDTSLNHTNFYKALNKADDFRQVLDQEPKSLYLQLKEQFNRDDIMSVIMDKNHTRIIQSFRRATNLNDSLDIDNELAEAVAERMLGTQLIDEHKYDENNITNIYWDPKQELLDLKEYLSPSGRRIYKGQRTTIQRYPFMVSVHVMGRFWCGGVLYWYDLVLTSAACLQLMHNNRFFRENPRVLQVRVGSNHSRISGELIDALEVGLLSMHNKFLQENPRVLQVRVDSNHSGISGELVDALEVYFHPTYSPRTLNNNIAVIRLRYQVHLSYHRVPKTINITHTPGKPAATEVLLLGWGVTKMSQRLAVEPIFLQRKFLPVYPNTFCKEVYGDKFINEQMFCAGTLTTGEGACDHDAGGPAVLSGKLVGIISFGPTVCGYPNAPTVFTLISPYADWIERVNESMPDYYRAKVRTSTAPSYDTYEVQTLKAKTTHEAVLRHRSWKH